MKRRQLTASRAQLEQAQQLREQQQRQQQQQQQQQQRNRRLLGKYRASSNQSLTRTPSSSYTPTSSSSATNPNSRCSCGQSTSGTPAPASSSCSLHATPTPSDPQARSSSRGQQSVGVAVEQSTQQQQQQQRQNFGQCRICRKTIGSNEPCHLCSNCQQFICDDCASYSSSDQHWMCSSCRRRTLNPAIPTEALKELGLNQNSSAVRRMTLRLNQNELKLALERKSSAANLATMQLQQQQQQQISDSSTTSSSSVSAASGQVQAGACGVSRSNSIRTTTPAAASSSTSGSQRSAGASTRGPASQRSLERVAQENKQRTTTASRTGSSPSHPANLTSGGGGGGGSAIKTQAHHSSGCAGAGAGSGSGSGRASGSAGGSPSHGDGRRSYCEMRAAKLSAQKTMSQPSPSAGNNNNSNNNQQQQQTASSNQSSPARRQLELERERQIQQQQQSCVQGQAALWNAPEVAEDLERRASMVAAARRNSIAPQLPPPQQQQQTYEDYPMQQAHEQQLHQQQQAAAAYGNFQYDQQQQQQQQQWQQQMAAPPMQQQQPPQPQQAPYEMSGFISSSPLGSRRSSRGHLGGGGGGGGFSQLMMPSEQMHVRRLSDQSNLFRRSSIIADHMEGVQIARNRSHSNIDTVHQVTSYLYQAHDRGGSNNQLQAQQQPLLLGQAHSQPEQRAGNYAAAAAAYSQHQPHPQQQQPSNLQDQLAYQQRQSDQQLHRPDYGVGGGGGGLQEHQRAARPGGSAHMLGHQLSLGHSEAANSMSSSNVLYLPNHHGSNSNFANQHHHHQRRLSDSGQYMISSSVASNLPQQQQISSIITTYAQKKPASQQQQQQTGACRQSSEDLDQAADSSSSSELDMMHQQQAGNMQIPSVSVSEFSQAARRQSIHMQQQQQQQRRRQQNQDEQQQQQQQLIYAHDNQITPMQINVAIEQVIQQQQQHEQQLLSLSGRRGSSGRVLPRIPGEPNYHHLQQHHQQQQSRSLLVLPGGGQESGQDCGSNNQNGGGGGYLTDGRREGLELNGLLQGGHQANQTLDLPLLSPTIRRASAPEGQNIKIVVDDIDRHHHHHQQNQQQQHQHQQLLLHGHQLNGKMMAQQQLNQGRHQPFRTNGTTTNTTTSTKFNMQGQQMQPLMCDFLERHILCRHDSLDPTGLHVGRGFGLQVMGGKLNRDEGQLEACIAWVMPGGPADKVGLRAGDKIIEWDGKCLLEMSYEQVAEVIESSANVAELLVKPTPQRLNDPQQAPTSYLRSQRRMSQQTERDLRKSSGGCAIERRRSNAVCEPQIAHLNGADKQPKPSSGRAGTGRRLPQIPPSAGGGGGGDLSAKNSNEMSTTTTNHLGSGGGGGYFSSMRHASTGQLDYAHEQLANLTSQHQQQLNNSASSQLNQQHHLGAFMSSQQQQQQQSRSASELHRGSVSGLADSATQAYMQQQQRPHQQQPYITATTTNGSHTASAWSIQQQQQQQQQHSLHQQQQQYGGSQRTVMPTDYLGQQLNIGASKAPHQIGYFSGSQMHSLNPVMSQTNALDEMSGLIGLQVNVDERSATLEISILAAHNIDRDPTLDYIVSVKILPESSRFKVCKTQPSNEMNWKETFLFQNFPIQNVHRMALEIGIWVHDETPRLSTQMAQPICEALIPIQSARERNIDFWPLRPPPTSPQARRKSLNDLVGGHINQQQQQQPAFFHQQQQQHHDGGAGGGHMLPNSYTKQQVAQAVAAAAAAKQQMHNKRTSPMGSSARLYQAGESPTLTNYYQRERSSSNRNLPEVNKLQTIQPRRASDEVATSSSHRLVARISPAASRRSISVMNVGGDSPFNVVGGRLSSSRLGSQANLLKAAQMRRDSGQQHAYQQQPATHPTSPSKFSSPTASGSASRASGTTTTAAGQEGAQSSIGFTPSGRRSSLAGIQSMSGYRSQKSSQSDATDHESPIGLAKRARESATPTSHLTQQQHLISNSTSLLNNNNNSRSQQQQQQQRQQSPAPASGHQQLQQPRQVSSGPTSTRPSCSSSGGSRRNSVEQQQRDPPHIQRRGSFALQTLRKLKRTMSLTKSENSPANSNQESRRSSDASEQSVTEPGDELAATRTIKPSDNVVGRIKLSFLLTKGQFEVEVVCASGLKLDNQESALGVYVKMYLRGRSKSNKRKTRVVQQQLDAPIFRQTIRYDGSLVDNKLLEVSVWVKQGTLRGKVPVGMTEIRLSEMNLTQLQTSWYSLRPINSHSSSSVED